MRTGMAFLCSARYDLECLVGRDTCLGGDETPEARVIDSFFNYEESST